MRMNSKQHGTQLLPSITIKKRPKGYTTIAYNSQRKLLDLTTETIEQASIYLLQAFQNFIWYPKFFFVCKLSGNNTLKGLGIKTRYSPKSI